MAVPTFTNFTSIGFDGVKAFDSVLYFEATVDPVSMIDGAGSTFVVTTPAIGIELGDFLLCAPGINSGGLLYEARIAATNDIRIRFQNNTGGTLDIGASTWKFLIFKRS